MATAKTKTAKTDAKPDTVTVELPADLHKALKEEAKKVDITVPQFIGALLQLFRSE